VPNVALGIAVESPQRSEDLEFEMDFPPYQTQNYQELPLSAGKIRDKKGGLNLPSGFFYSLSSLLLNTSLY
jgi:hypothetical protein